MRQYARLLELPASEYEGDLDRNLTDEQTTIAAQPSSLPERLSVPPLPTGMRNPAEETRRWLLRLGALIIVILLCSLIYTLSMNWKSWFSSMLPSTAPEPPAAQAPVKEKKPDPAAQPPYTACATPNPAPRNTRRQDLQLTPPAQPPLTEAEACRAQTCRPPAAAPPAPSLPLHQGDRTGLGPGARRRQDPRLEQHSVGGDALFRGATPS